MSKKIVAVGIVLLLVAGACSSRTDPAGERSLLGSDDKDRAGEDGKKRGSKKGGVKKPRNGGVVSQDEGAVGGGDSSIPDEVDVPGADEDKTYPTAFAEIEEPNPDGKTQGITPQYAEMLGLSIEGVGEEFRITMTFNGDVPQQMPNDKTIMVIGFQFLRGKQDGYAFAGQATEKGWKPYAGGKDKRTEFPGSFEVSGNTIVMTIPWSYVGGAYPFKWLATSNWFQSLANTTHYIFDLIPNKGQANYPG